MKVDLFISDIAQSTEHNLICSAIHHRFDPLKLKTGVLRAGDVVAAVAPTVLGQYHSFPMQFGFWDDSRKRDKMIRATGIETAENKLIFYDGIFQRRCVVPVNGFFVSGKDECGNKLNYLVSMPGKEMFYLAGIYKKLQGKPHVILLTAKAQGENMMYCERLPITVPRNACKRWIDPKRRIKRIWEDWKQNYIFEVTEYERTENQ